MRLVSFVRAGVTRAGAIVDDCVVDLAAAYAAIPCNQREGSGDLPTDTMALLAQGDLGLAGAAQVARLAIASHARGEHSSALDGSPVCFPLSSVQLTAPVPRPAKIICLGLNYADHAAETGHPRPTTPILFPKFANTIIGPGEPIVLPRETTQPDYEVELAFVIGKRARNVPIERAYEYVAGYMILNDVSARDLQMETSQWLRGKTPDTFAPTGPWLATRDEIPNPQTLDVRSYVNGELRQNSNTAQLIFDVPFLVHHISKTITLLPGDIVSTGTPSGVGMAFKPPKFLKPGDVVRLEITGLGVLENPVVAE